jgi:hypothetical protein
VIDDRSDRIFNGHVDAAGTRSGKEQVLRLQQWQSGRRPVVPGLTRSERRSSTLHRKEPTEMMPSNANQILIFLSYPTSLRHEDENSDIENENPQAAAPSGNDTCQIAVLALETVEC